MQWLMVKLTVSSSALWSLLWCRDCEGRKTNLVISVNSSDISDAMVIRRGWSGGQYQYSSQWRALNKTPVTWPACQNPCLSKSQGRPGYTRPATLHSPLSSLSATIFTSEATPHTRINLTTLHPLLHCSTLRHSYN